jgi:uncharacterized membrane protein YraQ (UPF0718 family)/YHS domain-containing protein
MATDPVCGMSVNENKGLSLSHDGTTYYFCSEHCLEKFARERGVPGHAIAAACCAGAKTPLYKNKTIIAGAVLLFAVAASYGTPVLEPFRLSLFDYLRTIWWAILLGLLLGGVIDYYIPREYISHILARPRKRTILYSVILGFFASACSHGILALSIELHKKGASNPAVVSFLLASPWSNLTLTIMLLGFFGLKALYIIGSAFFIAITTGLIFQVLERKGIVEKNTRSMQLEEDFSIVADLKKRLRKGRFSAADIKGIYKGSVSLGNMVLWWILIGMGLASLAGAYIPPSVFENYMGPTLLGLFVTLALATVMEVCSEGSAPMAFEIFRQTGALGNSFVFLMGGVVTDYTEIGLLWHNVGKRTAIWLPVITVPQVVVLGIIANAIF